MNFKKILPRIGMCLVWFALITQFILMLLNREVSVFELIIRFFSYFTITTNLLVALYFTNLVWPENGFWRDRLRSGSAATAITTCILIVGIVYQTLLKDLWRPTGLQRVADQLLHGIIPLFMLGYWLVIVKSQNIGLKSVYSWLLYPIGYLAFALGRGYLSGFYPYPFLEIKKIGFTQTAINIGLIALGTIMMLTLLTAIGRGIQKLKGPATRHQ
ncbi:hypothetical protein B0I21_107247 [Sphingobacterium paludis]|uniref:FAR-17a/AIG1-like protein n=2 Tax=Sphingobacterium paludis TaxID=1476465 RepID=A0A4R7CXS8_9SPHI|nr:hypothetical protein B0I21_107247 [Sphingobacterium paludis]